MNPGYRHLLNLSFKAVDLLVMVVSFLIAAGSLVPASDWYSLRQLVEVRLQASNFLLFIFLMAAWYLIFAGFGLYRALRLASVRAEARDIVKATSVGSTAVLLVASLINIDFVTSHFLVVFWVTSTALTGFARLTLRVILERFRVRGRNLRNLLIIGTNARALRFAELVENKPTLGYQINGFIDDEWSGIDKFRQTGRQLVATVPDFGDYLREHVVDEVVISLPVSSYYSQ